MKRKILLLCLTGLFALSGHVDVIAETGSRIIGGGGKYPGNVIWFTEPREINDIRLLLQAGKKQLAVEKSRSYVARMVQVPGFEALVRLYYGLNALCSALTSIGDLSEAIDTCSDAIEIYPARWQAINNRGTAYYVSRQYTQAMQDYKQALNIKPNAGRATEIIQHNIKLTETKLAKT